MDDADTFHRDPEVTAPDIAGVNAARTNEIAPCAVAGEKPRAAQSPTGTRRDRRRREGAAWHWHVVVCG